VYSVTEAGRAHLREHRAEYQQFHPDLLVPELPDDSRR
jgi:DNA-binding PadR family transcriptional regulator